MPNCPTRLLMAGLALGLAACKTVPADPTGFSCAAGCMIGWVCHPELELCVPEVRVACDGTGVCPEDVQTNTPCSTADSFIPCFSGTTSCESGCRTCDGSSWSDCACDTGTMTNCSACGDDCNDLANVSAPFCETAMGAPTCAYLNCASGWTDLDDDASTGCENACTMTGAEQCNSADDDCNGVADDMTLIEVGLDCDAAYPAATDVQQWLCVAGGCQVAICVDGYYDIDGQPFGGCEYACTLVGPESCNGADDDCSGAGDDLTAGDLNMDCEFQYPLAADVNTWQCAGGCVIGSCNVDRYDINGVLGDGCEYTCAPVGAETCNGDDDDCNGAADDVANVQVDCAAQYPSAVHVAEWGCASACEIRGCQSGWVDLTGGIANGCEIACTPTVPADEVCDGADNDCDGMTDNEGSPGCTTFYRDADGDGGGVASDSRCLCVGIAPYTATASGDCDDGNSHCLATCTDLDGDNYCANQDCDDTSATGATCFNTCATFYQDSDGDGLGNSAQSRSRCVPPAGYIGVSGDCDDSNENCGVSCTDVDGDDYCVGIDCDDSNLNCTTDCTDSDNDGVCAPDDCNDTDADCTFVCAVCAPTELVLTGGGATPLCTPAELTISFGESEIPLATEISCSAPRQNLGRLTTFETGYGIWTSQSDVSIKSWPGGYPGGCPGSGSYAALAKRASASIAITAIDATGYRDVRFSLVAGYKSSPAAAEEIEVSSCCGAACTPTTLFTIANAAGGGTDSCTNPSADLNADDCSALKLGIAWVSDVSEAGVDDLRISAEPLLPPVTAQGISTFSTSVSSCAATNMVVTCTWDNGVDPPLSDTATIVFQ